MPYNTKEKRNAYQRKRRKEKILKGICEECWKPATGGSQLCAKHREIYRLKNIRNNDKYRERLAKERRCVRCATPLEEDEGRTCMNCSGKRERKDMTYAAHRVRFTD